LLLLLFYSHCSYLFRPQTLAILSPSPPASPSQAADLAGLLQHASAQGRRLQCGVVKLLALMLLRGVADMHACGLMHRDLKPGNVLFAAGGALKLGDLGLARVRGRGQEQGFEGRGVEGRGQGGGDLSHDVATRWYRAPELLYGARRYDGAVDVWACGCILGELVNQVFLSPSS
jgi:cell cycle related kinase